VKPKPYYDEGGITIYHGNSLDLLHLVVDEQRRPDAVLADPPYGFESYPTDVVVPVRWLGAVAPRLALFGYPELLCGWCLELGKAPDEWITWWPTNATVKAGGRHALLPRETEAIAIFGADLNVDAVRVPRSENRPSVNGERGDTVRAPDVWRDASPGLGFNSAARLHPNEKPLSLLHKLVLLCSEPGELIVDPFMGSGTTLRAAKDLGRRAIGIDLVESHCATAVKRLRQEVLFA
jgi:site-specific DNA-methyltransferase (adenine-specific)